MSKLLSTARTCVWVLAATITSAPAVEPPTPASLDELLITATRANTGVSAALFGSSFTVIDSAALQSRQTRVLSDVLRDVPGIAVNRSGAQGGTTQVRMRGTEANHTFVMIDGIEAADPFNGEFDFAYLIADSDARVEVLRGPQSALYGSDAIGGVIHYITASGAEAPGLKAAVESGSFETVNAGLRWGGVSGPLDYAVSGSYLGTAGVATALNGTRKVGNWLQNYGGKATWSLSENFRLKAAGRLVQSRAQYNDQDFNFTSPTYGQLIDTDSYSTQQSIYGLVRAELELLDGAWSHALSAQGVDADFRSYSYAFGGSFFTTGARNKLSYESTYRFGSDAAKQAITLAVDRRREHYQNLAIFAPDASNLRRTLNNTGVVAEYELNLGGRWGFGAALRHDANSYFDDADTFRVQGAYRMDGGLKLRAAVGSGVKNPTNFELFGFDPNSFVGNPALKPEKSTGWEAGFDQSLLDEQISLGLTYFDSKLRDEIFTAFLPGFLSAPRNRITDSTQKGIEASAAAQLGEVWRIDAAYAYVDSVENELEETRRPKHSGSVNVAWRTHADRAGLSLTVRYNGAAVDNDFATGSRVDLGSFNLVNLAGDWKFSERLTGYARVENLFDEEYQEVFGYGVAGVGAYVGVQASF
ncbi:MAG: TonB-dependent receptor [Steroidobacteraceae bacterium]